jgi:predicted RNase H-like HicB family nuclease
MQVTKTNLLSKDKAIIGGHMLIEYIDKAMSKAVYEILEDGTYAGRIPLCPGVVAFGKTLYECQNELESVLEGWLIVKIRHGDPLPVIGRIDLNKGVPTLKEVAYG